MYPGCSILGANKVCKSVQMSKNSVGNYRNITAAKSLSVCYSSPNKQTPWTRGKSLNCTGIAFLNCVHFVDIGKKAHTFNFLTFLFDLKLVDCKVSWTEFKPTKIWIIWRKTICNANSENTFFKTFEKSTALFIKNLNFCWETTTERFDNNILIAHILI